MYIKENKVRFYLEALHGGMVVGHVWRRGGGLRSRVWTYMHMVGMHRHGCLGLGSSGILN
jgi:hypothetical protein